MNNIEQARKLIRSKDYYKARQILTSIKDDPNAKRLLQHLDKIDPMPQLTSAELETIKQPVGGIVNRSYEYSVVPFYPTTVSNDFELAAEEMSRRLQNLINSMSVKGWEFFRVDEITIVEPQGCFDYNKPRNQANYYVVTFRRCL